MSNYSIFLDNIRETTDVTWVQLPNVTWTIVRTYKEFVELITEKSHAPSFVSYDHDLSDYTYVTRPRIDKFGIIQTDQHKIGEKTGYDCAKWLTDYCSTLEIKHPPYTVHSLDSVGAENIYEYIDNYNFKYSNKCQNECDCNCES